MNIPYIKGKVSGQAHVAVPEGTYEEEYARNGFSGGYAHLYRNAPPVNWTKIEGPLRPRSFDLNDPKFQSFTDYIQGRHPYFYNDDIRIHFFNLSVPMAYYFRNADADEVFFIHEGAGRLETDFGPMIYEKGDYLVIPRGTVYRWDVSKPTSFLLTESMSEVRFPDKGMLGQHALFDPALIRVPTPEAPMHPIQGDFMVKIQRCNEITTVHYPTHPMSTVGWKGTLSAYQLNVRDIRPVLSDRYHLPPSAHSTLVGHNFVICTFLPRPLENGDPEAMKVPFYHSNIDFDELIFYHDGDFFSRQGIAPGMMTLHPQGIHHGPQPKAVERAKAAKATQEIAVMIDTRRPLNVSPRAGDFENLNYWKSWQE